MSEFLRQLGFQPWLYWLGAGGTLALWLASAALPGDAAGRPWARCNPPALFGALLLLTMLAWRWPAVFHFHPVNPDEPQFLAGAITMLARSEIWWVAPTTSGPLVVLPLVLPKLVGLPVDYSSGRLVGLLLNWGTVMLAYLTLRHVHGDRKARLLVLPLAAFFVLLVFWDFVEYCSELAPLCLCALAGWLCVSAFQPDGSVGRRWRLAGGGLVLGLLPFSKLQVLPLGAAVGLATVVWIFGQPGADRREVGRTLLVFAAAGAGGFVLPLVGLWQSGNLAEFHQFYWVHNLQYAQSRAVEWTASGYALRYLTDFSWGFSSFHFGLLGLLGFGLLGVRRTAWRPRLFGWLLLPAAYFAVLAPGRLYPHYLLLLSWPLALLAGLLFGGLISSAGGQRSKAAALWTVFFLAGLVPQVIDRVSDRHSLVRLAPVKNARTVAVGFINQVKRPGDTLAAWGWRPELYVETQLPQATREALTDAQMQDTPQRDYFRARYLADLRANRPEFFVDTVGPEDYGHKDAGQQGHESFPQLDAYVRQEYQLVSKAAPIRVYVRRNLAEKSSASASP